VQLLPMEETLQIAIASSSGGGFVTTKPNYNIFPANSSPSPLQFLLPYSEQ